MRAVISKFFGDIGRIFSEKNLVWHGAAIVITYILVVTGFDWWIVTTFGQSTVRSVAFSAGFIGFYAPIVVPLIYLAVGYARRNSQFTKTGWLIAQAEITGLLLSSFYKVFTGRPGPTQFHAVPPVDMSHVFRFGFYEGGVFWGWPSSHITVAVAGAVVLMLLYRHNTVVKYLACAYAVYMALAVSITFHWFSDGVAGVIFGTIVGLTVLKSAKKINM